MGVKVVSAAQPIVTLQEAKRHLRVDFDEDDLVIAGFTAAAQAHIDGPSGKLGRALGKQTLKFSMDGCDLWPAAYVDLPYPPFIRIVNFEFIDDEGETKEHPSDAVVATDRHGVARLLPAYGASWPVPRRSPDAVSITYEAGYDASSAEVQPIKQAILLMIGHWYQNREAATPGKLEAMPMAVDALLGPYRIWGF